MDKRKVLIVTQEMDPYTALSEISQTVQKLPQYLLEKGLEIRVLMPRFGTINERRHRLHEVVRLSGMNIIVNDDDFPLIIKVASLPGARLQVYFLDNDEFFKRKSVFEDADGQAFEDNIDRMVFFCKGAIETVKKFGWPPDVVHCHGWMTSMIPLYLRVAYKSEPLFENTKIIYSLYEDSLERVGIDNFFEKASINNLKADDLVAFQDGKEISLHKGAATFSDAIISGSENLSPTVKLTLDSLDKPILDFKTLEECYPAYLEFYESVLTEKIPG